MRQHGDDRLLCAFNLDGRPASLALRPGDDIVEVLDAPGMSRAEFDGAHTSFEPWGVLLARLA